MRYKHLDGMRGIASIFIVFSHIVQLYIPYLIYGTENLRHSNIENILLDFPFTLSYNGNTMIHIFFIVGGFVAVISCDNLKKFSLNKKIIKRYVRLVIPIFITTVLVYIILNTTGFVYNNLDEYTFNSSIITPKEKMGVLTAIKYSFFDVFVYGDIFKKSILSYNHVLWTIKVEFISSIIIYFICKLIDKKSYYRIICFIVVICILPSENKECYCTYFIGAIIGELFIKNKLSILNKNRYVNYFIFILSIVLMGYPYVIKSIIYRNLPNTLLNSMIFGSTDLHSILHLIGVILFITIVLNSEGIKKFFSRNILVKLGDISYSIYLLHWVLLLSIMPALLLMLRNSFNYWTSLVISSSMFFIILITGSIILNKISNYIFSIFNKKFI